MAKGGGARLRVHGGEARGRRLEAPRGIRPTQGVVKEAIFNMVAGAVAGARVLDLFSGSGALGIEALSRGAAEVTFVDREHSSVSILRRNLEALGYLPHARVVRSDVARWLRANRPAVAGANLIFLDPPYGDGSLDRALAALDEDCGPGCLIVAEHSRREVPQQLARVAVDRTRDYGDTTVTILSAS